MKLPRLLPAPVRALALCSVLLSPLTAGLVVDDRFEDGDPTGSSAHPGFWKLQAISGDNGVFENNGYLTLFAVKHPFTFAGLNSRLDEQLNFFSHAVTITVEDLLLEHKEVPDHEAVFRLSLNSTELRQNVSPQSVSLRFVPGLVLFGFKTDHVEKMAAEDLMGTTKGSALYERFDGRATGFSLTLDPFAEPGTITATLVLTTTGSRPTITRTARLNLRRSDWSSGGASALVMEARRNHEVMIEDSYMSASLGRLTVTNYAR